LQRDVMKNIDIPFCPLNPKFFHGEWQAVCVSMYATPTHVVFTLSRAELASNSWQAGRDNCLLRTKYRNEHKNQEDINEPRQTGKFVAKK